MRTNDNKTEISLRLRLLFMLLITAFAICMAPNLPYAYAAGEDKPSQVDMHIGNDATKTDVMKQVATLDVNMEKGTSIQFDIQDQYNNVSNDRKRRQLVLEDSSGKQTTVCESNTNNAELKSDKMVLDQKLKLITLTKGDKDNDFVKRYEQQLNVRFIDAKKSEQNPSDSSTSAMAGVSKDGSSWSFSNGLQYTFKDCGLSFLEGTTMNLGAIMLPLKYSHETDGTTIVGINCGPDDKDFFEAIKNGNVWQKYTADDVAKKTSQMDKGWSGKKFGSWGEKMMDWNICGFMEYNTKNPNAPRALNLILSAGLSAEGHAQYLCFTGTLTFTAGGKAMIVGKLSPSWDFEKVEKVGFGVYAGLELYIGVGLQYVASVGAYGKGEVNIDFIAYPSLYLDSVKLSGELGAKGKVFGFTLFTWKILEGEKSLYTSPKKEKEEKEKKKQQDKLKAQSEDGTATSPFTVDADTPYPQDSRDYLNSNEALTAQATSSANSILQGIYGETELSCATTSEGPVIAYIADAAQVGDSSRNAANRSVLVYSRFKNGVWTAPKIIDTTEKSGKYADYTPTISTDGETCYVAWLAADSSISDESSIGDVGKKLDVNVATITKDDHITVETVCEESDDEGTMPASPKAIKVGDDLYVGWYTNQTTGHEGEVIGVSGSHNIRLYKKVNNTEGVTAQDAGVETTTQENADEAESDVAQSTSTEATTQSENDASSAAQSTSVEATTQTEDASSTAQSSDSEATTAQSSDAELTVQADDSREASAQSPTSENSASEISSTDSANALSTDLVTTTQSDVAEAVAEAVAESAAASATDSATEGDAEPSSDAEGVTAQDTATAEDEEMQMTTAETAAAGWKKTSEVTSGQSGAITSFDVGLYGGKAACAWSLDENFSSAQKEITLNDKNTLDNSTVYFLVPESTQAEILAQGATNAQFAKYGGVDVLTYAIRISENDGITSPYLSVQSSSTPGDAGTVVLDGAKVTLPTPYYKIAGDLGSGRAGNISFVKAGSGTSDIQALVTTGAGATDWTSIVEATADTAAVYDYCSTYVGGSPLFVYTTERETASVDDELSAQAEDDGSVDLNQTTEESLKHLRVDDVDYDEYEVDSGQMMPMTVYFANDGLLDVSGTDLWLLDDGVATKVASGDVAVAMDEEGSISFEYAVPNKDAFTKARELTLYAAPAGATVTADKIAREVSNESAVTVSLGAASLSLDAEQQIVDGQESIVAKVTNDGIASHGAKMVFLDSNTDEVLKSMDVPELSENESFTGTLDAESGYFQNSGIEDITVTLEDDGRQSDSYEINNTEFFHTWDVDSQTTTTGSNSQGTNASGSDNAQGSSSGASTRSKVPNTSDQTSSAQMIALAGLAVIATSFIIRRAEKVNA